MEIDFTESGDTEGTWLVSLLFMELKSNLEQNKMKIPPNLMRLNSLAINYKD